MAYDLRMTHQEASTMAIRDNAKTEAEQRDVLRHLIREQGIGQYALFFVSGEGDETPDGVEEASGYLVDETGRVYSFWLGWDPRHGRTALTEWERVDPDPDWIEEPEYRRALQTVGLA
jgi:hypothetical protein